MTDLENYLKLTMETEEDSEDEVQEDKHEQEKEKIAVLPDKNEF
jgi:hypothetical protein